MSGEATQEKGADGARRAKSWLESTTRANVHWVNPEPYAVPKLTFSWKEKGTFSFDLGGTLHGQGLEGQCFFAEVKKYKKEQDLPAHYTHFLASCYRAFELRPEQCDNFMWISWSPFSASRWDQLMTTEKVKESVLTLKEKALGVEDSVQASEIIDEARCKAVADRLWMIVLSDRQEVLTLTPRHLGLIKADNAERGSW